MLKKQYKIFFGGIWYFFFSYQTRVFVFYVFFRRNRTRILIVVISRCIYIKSHVELMWKSLRINSFFIKYISFISSFVRSTKLVLWSLLFISHYFARSETELRSHNIQKAFICVTYWLRPLFICGRANCWFWCIVDNRI